MESVTNKWLRIFTERMTKDADEYMHMSNMSAIESYPLNGSGIIGHTIAQASLAVRDTLKGKSSPTVIRDDQKNK